MEHGVGSKEGPGWDWDLNHLSTRAICGETQPGALVLFDRIK